MLVFQFHFPEYRSEFFLTWFIRSDKFIWTLVTAHTEYHGYYNKTVCRYHLSGKLRRKYPDITGEFVLVDLVKGPTGLGMSREVYCSLWGIQGRR